MIAETTENRPNARQSRRSVHGFTKEDLYERVRASKRGCWLWQGNVREDGYGRATIQGHTYFAHRLSHLLHFGPIPKGKKVMQTCGNRRCVNPKHLKRVSPRDVVREALKRGSFAVGSRTGNTALGPKDVRRIRRLHAAGKKSYAELAEEYGMSRSGIIRIVLRQRWKHLG